MSITARREPRIDPTMHIHCPTHSERSGSDGGRRGPVPATYQRDEYGAFRYVCWHCAMDRHAAEVLR